MRVTQNANSPMTVLSPELFASKGVYFSPSNRGQFGGEGGGEGARMDAAGPTAKMFQFSMSDVTQLAALVA